MHFKSVKDEEENVKLDSQAIETALWFLENPADEVCLQVRGTDAVCAVLDYISKWLAVNKKPFFAFSGNTYRSTLGTIHVENLENEPGALKHCCPHFMVEAGADLIPGKPYPWLPVEPLKVPNIKAACPVWPGLT